MNGCHGVMGHVITDIISKDDAIEIVAGVDMNTETYAGYPVFKSLAECPEADVIIDFSSPEALEDRLKFAEEKGAGIVLACTGFSEKELSLVDEYSARVAIFKTANLSLGINLMQALCKAAAEVLGEAFDVEIVERHHNLKKDAPSGTALMLADSINEVFDGKKKYVEGRSGIVGARTREEIGIHAVRGGTIVGEHEVMFAGEDEILTISHSARSKRVFAAGAIRAAKFLAGKAPGKYDMQNLLNS